MNRAERRRRRRGRKSDRNDLSIDEVWVPEGALPEEYRRNQAYFWYRFGKESGGLGAFAIWVYIGGLVLLLVTIAVVSFLSLVNG